MALGNKTNKLLAATALILCLSSFSISADEPVKTSFAWGADAGGSIDLSGNDMSSADISASFGFKRGWINFLGLGAEIDIMLNNSARSFPVYLSFKTNFRNRPTLLFLDFRAGISANYLPNDYQQTGSYAFVGLGINLARGKLFSSHLVIGYSYKEYRDIVTREEESFPMKDVHCATIKLGITF